MTDQVNTPFTKAPESKPVGERLQEGVQQLTDKMKEVLNYGREGPGVWAIKAYKPHPGKEEALVNLLPTGIDALKTANLIEDCCPLFLQSKGGEIIEAIQWKSSASIEKGMDDDSLRSIWERIKSAGDLVPLTELQESKELYPTFQVVDLPASGQQPSCANIVIKNSHQDKDHEVVKKLATHDKTIEKLGLRTSRPSIHARADTGQIVVITLWHTGEAEKQAMNTEQVTSLWNEFQNISDELTIADVPAFKKEIASLSSLRV